MIVKTTTTYHRGSTTSTESYTYEYTNGNLTKRIDGDRASIAYYEYYPDKEANYSEVELLHTLGFAWTSPSKNPLKKFTYGSHVWEYTYEFNEKGFVTKSTFQSSYNGFPNGQTLLIYTYTCN